MMAQDVVHLDDVQVVAHRRLKDVGVEMTKLDTMVLHENISLSMADILSKHSTVFVKSYGRATALARRRLIRSTLVTLAIPVVSVSIRLLSFARSLSVQSAF